MRFIGLENDQDGTDDGVDLLDPEANATFRVEPSWQFGLTEDDFERSPTRWSFGG